MTKVATDVETLRQDLDAQEEERESLEKTMGEIKLDHDRQEEMQKSLQIQQDTLRRELNERFGTLLESFGALDESFRRCDDRIKYLE